MPFVNREDELGALERWYASRAGEMSLVWGRRRVGKTALLQRFAKGKRSILHEAGGRPLVDELRMLSREAASVLPSGARDLTDRPFTGWDDLLDTMAEAARHQRLLLVLDEFPELVRVTPALPALLRAFWERVRSWTKLRVLLCGSAVRVMREMQEERAPLYGRMGLSLLVHPLEPVSAAKMLPSLSPSDRAIVWGLVGGIPLYLSWWDQGATIRENLAHLVCEPGGRLLVEGQLVLATEADAGDLASLVLHAIARGRTRHGEIADAVGAEPARTLERLAELRLAERTVPVTEDPRRSRKRLYRLQDNFLSFWLGVVDRYRGEIERGLGPSILPALLEDVDDFMGPRWEDAFRAHLRRLAREGRLGPDVVSVGRWWRDPGEEIDAVVLSGRRREATLVGEAKWARKVDAQRIERDLATKAEALPRRREPVRQAICARERITGASRETLLITAEDIF